MAKATSNKKQAEKKEKSKAKTPKKSTTGRTASRKKEETGKKTAPENKARETVSREEPETNQKAQETTEERLKKAGDRLSGAADRGVEVLKEVFGKVKGFSVDATELTRLKVEIYRLKGDKDRMLTIVGEKLWEMRNSEKMKSIRSIFEDDFEKLEKLNSEIEKKEKTASKISL